MRLIALFALAAGLALAAVGCGGSSDESSSGGGTPLKTVQVSETEYKLDPADVTVDKAGTYTFHAVNDGGTDHALEIEGNGVEEETDTLAPGDSGDLTVDLKAGTYEVYCPISNHRERGMEAKLVVAGGGAGGGTTTGETDDTGGGQPY